MDSSEDEIIEESGARLEIGVNEDLEPEGEMGMTFEQSVERVVDMVVTGRFEKTDASLNDGVDHQFPSLNF